MPCTTHHHKKKPGLIKKMAMPSVFMLAAALVLAAAAAAAAKSPVVTFVFGDSLTDVGNNNHLRYSLAKANYPWYGIDYKFGLPTGRFTNGRTIGDFISAKLGILSPLPYLSLAKNDVAVLQGVNYASGGAGILNETGTYFVEKLSFDDQIDCFEKTKATITSMIGEKAAEKLCNEAVYFIGLGSNDYINNFLQPFLADARLFTHREFLAHLTSTLEGQLRRLHGLGARKVVFHGLGPLGCIPSQRVRSGNGECREHVNQYMLEFNSDVKTLLSSMNSKLPGAKMALSECYGIVMDLIKNPERYGFKISNTSCCNVNTSIGGLCLPNAKVCSDRREYVFWDDYHPTDAANAVIADILFTDPDIRQAPSPAPIPHHKPNPVPKASPAPAPAPAPSFKTIPIPEAAPTPAQEAAPTIETVPAPAPSPL